MADKVPLLVIAGPTAVGKSRLALTLAQRSGGEIISADSAQVYRGMDIGTAKPTAAERETVPHHLLDIVSPEVNFTVADYQQLAKETIRDVWGRGKLPILTGGTGLYIKAVVDHYAFSPSAANPVLRQELENIASKKGITSLYNLLKAVDPETADKTNPANLRRTIRGLEHYYLTGKPVSSQYRNTQKNDFPYEPFMFCLIRPRQILYKRIEKRVNQMLNNGLLQEVKSLLNKGYTKDLKSMQTLGYRQLANFLQGETEWEQAIEKIKINTRRYAKRQLTWFKKDNRYKWIDLEQEGEQQTINKIISYIAGISV